MAKRTKAIKKLIFSACIVVFCMGCQSNKGISFKQSPNVIFILADDLNDKVGFLDEYIKASTPNLNKLAELSTNFTNAHVSATVCNPSRLAILTSKQPYNTGVYELYPAEASQVAIDKFHLLTIMDSFKNSDYVTAGTGKILHWGNDSSKYFDVFFATQSSEDTQEDRVNPNWRVWDKPEEALADSRKTKWAINFLNQKHDKPFFMMIGYESPHLPWIVPEKYHRQNSHPLKINSENNCQDLDDIDPRITNLYKKHIIDMKELIYQSKPKDAIKAYLASVSFLDAQIGSLLENLKKNNLLENTIIVFTSDHGFHLGEKCLMRKKTLWKESTHVPLLIYIPGLKNSKYPHPVSLLDIYPTLIDVCNLNSNNNLDGTSLRPALEGKLIKNNVVITTQGYKNHAFKWGHWTYIKYHSGAEELYNNKKDPLEKNNLIKNPKYQNTKNMFKQKIKFKNQEPLEINGDLALKES